MKNINLSDLVESLALHVENTWAKYTHRSPQETAQALLSFKRASHHYQEMRASLGKLRGKKLLEIGSGYGLFIVLCLKDGIKAQGIEPAGTDFYKYTLKMSQQIIKRAGFKGSFVKNAYAENLPYPDNSFDIVASFYTLEHVANVKKVLKESTRVLKPEGISYHVIPNYGSFWEGHYGIP